VRFDGVSSSSSLLADFVVIDDPIGAPQSAAIFRMCWAARPTVPCRSSKRFSSRREGENVLSWGIFPGVNPKVSAKSSRLPKISGTLARKRVKRALESLDYLSKKQQLLKAEREIDEILDSIYEWEVVFQDESRTDSTKANKQTLNQLGFPGEHSYSDPLAFLQKADDRSAEEQKFYLLDSSEIDDTEE